MPSALGITYSSGSGDRTKGLGRADMTTRSRIAVLGLFLLLTGLGLPAGPGPDAQPAGLVRPRDTDELRAVMVTTVYGE